MPRPGASKRGAAQRRTFASQGAPQGSGSAAGGDLSQASTAHRSAAPRGAPQVPFAAHAAEDAGAVLAQRLAKVRAMEALPADAASWLRSEELQDELRAVLAGWRSWPEDGRCDDSVRAVALLLAAVDAAPADLEVSS